LKDMSFEDYADLNKLQRDCLEENFDTKFSLKTTSEGPIGIKVVTDTEFLPESKILPSNIALSVKCPFTGIAFNKLAITSYGEKKYELDAAYEINKLPGLALALKGGCDGQGTHTTDIGVGYKHAHGSVSTILSVNESPNAPRVAFLKNSFVANASALANKTGATWLNNLQVGFTADINLPQSNVTEKCCPIRDFGAALSWSTVDGRLAAVFRGVDKFNTYDVSLYGKVTSKVAFVGKVDVNPKSSEFSYDFGTVYDPCPNTQIKAKVNKDCQLSASIAKKLPKNVSIVGAASVDCHNVSAVKFGFSTVIGE